MVLEIYPVINLPGRTHIFDDTQMQQFNESRKNLIERILSNHMRHSQRGYADQDMARAVNARTMIPNIRFTFTRSKDSFFKLEVRFSFDCGAILAIFGFNINPL